MNPPLIDPRRKTVERLAQEVRRYETLRAADAGIVKTGCAGLDGLLPQGGFRRATLVEWIAATPGCGATTLALIVAREACGAGGHWAVIDADETFYPPAAQAWGLPLERLILIRPGRREEARWATDQALRCAGLAAVITWADSLDSHTFRRWQLAVEQSGVLGLLVRPHQARREPTWAEVRLGVEPCRGGERRRRVRVEVLQSRGPGRGRSVEVQLDHERHCLSAAPRRISDTGPTAAGGVSVVSPLAQATPSCGIEA